MGKGGTTMAELSKKEQRRMLVDNFGIPLDNQERAVSMPHLVFAKAGLAVRAYSSDKQEVDPTQQFCIRMCLLVFDEVTAGCSVIRKPSIIHVNLSDAEKSAKMLATAYCDKHARLGYGSHVTECLESIRLARRGGEFVMNMEYLATVAEVVFIDAFCQAIKVFREIFTDIKKQNRIEPIIREVMANR